MDVQMDKRHGRIRDWGLATERFGSWNIGELAVRVVFCKKFVAEGGRRKNYSMQHRQETNARLKFSRVLTFFSLLRVFRVPEELFYIKETRHSQPLHKFVYNNKHPTTPSHHPDIGEKNEHSQHEQNYFPSRRYCC